MSAWLVIEIILWVVGVIALAQWSHSGYWYAASALAALMTTAYFFRFVIN